MFPERSIIHRHLLVAHSEYQPFLLVTFPVDLGNRTYETNLKSLLGDSCEHHRFAADQADNLEKGIDYRRNFRDRMRGAAKLRAIVKKATSQNKKILFHGISPALFSFGSWKRSQTCIILDWTRCLYPRTLGVKCRKNMAWRAHRTVLNSCRKVLCMTQAARENVILDYEIDESKTCLVPAPFDLASLSMPPRKTPASPRFLFMGGDLLRKGGDVLIDAVKDGRIPSGVLTMASNDSSADIPGISYRPNIKFGTPEHRSLFESHDVFVLPTRMDSFPQVVGEAAAMGLTVITTKYALGAPQIIQNGLSGYITENPVDIIDLILRLREDPPKIDVMKNLIYHDMIQNFSMENIRASYLTEPWK